MDVSVDQSRHDPLARRADDPGPRRQRPEGLGGRVADRDDPPRGNDEERIGTGWVSRAIDQRGALDGERRREQEALHN